jgi:hypothetical protein
MPFIRPVDLVELVAIVPVDLEGDTTFLEIPEFVTEPTVMFVISGRATADRLLESRVVAEGGETFGFCG